MTRRTDFKQLLKLQLRKLGWDVQRYSPYEYRTFQIKQCLQHVGVDLVFDIGANTGEFAEKLRDSGYTGEIVSFEPLSDAYRLLAEGANDDPKWIIHPRCAVGDVDGEIEINIAGNSTSSSILPMLESHSEVAEGSAYVGSEQVSIFKLDKLAPAYLTDRPHVRYFVKIDTQGFECQVLDGGAETIRNAAGVLCELSISPLYEGQRLWREMIDRLEGEGFTLWALIKGFTDTSNGRSLQVDGVFLRV